MTGSAMTDALPSAMAVSQVSRCAVLSFGGHGGLGALAICMQRCADRVACRAYRWLPGMAAAKAMSPRHRGCAGVLTPAVRDPRERGTAAAGCARRSTAAVCV